MKYYVLLVLTVLFWSGNFIFGRLVSSSIEPMQLSFFRWFFVLLLLSPFLIINYKNILKVFKKEYLVLLILGSLGISGFNTFLYYGLQTTTATNALLINSSIPIFIIILSAIIFKTSITKIQFSGVILSTLGVIYLILKGEIDHIFELEFTHGDLWIIAACVDWALYTVLLKYKPKELNSIEFFSITTLIGTIILFIVFLYQGYSFEFSFLEKNEVLYSLAYIVIFPSILSFYFWNRAILEVGANKAGQFTHLMPIFGAILAYFFLGEVMQTYHIVGIILIFLGIYLSIFLKKREK
ncbi:MAG: DMT family transporter [Arcobacter sp.]|jgi:drug/metabolite transporter (DMT)-like permease|uniref:EamA/RhaT family transporter n=1 Tax=Arcobacter defluvii TaxID=873191 RepID=A0AAE7E7X0_9BACT|nr:MULTISPECIES: DMT family transporter [Arcobacter]MDY3199471.1 DMT family transporter [Arcobacter sp.]QKF78696.1 EamA/RhaT family transporter [Arcobacter defluvii]RXI33990.1 EamA family transporter [Arcobacter defluvii]